MDDDWFVLFIGNGYLVINVFSDVIYVDGVFNGYCEDSYWVWILFIVFICVISEVIFEVYCLDMRNGMYLLEN